VGGGSLLYLSLFAIVRQAARKINEQQANLVKMQSHLVASQRMAAIGEIAGAVAHGIGNPLSSIRAVAQVAILDSDALAPSAQSRKIVGTLRSIIQQVDRVQKRMSELLNFAKPLEPRPVLVDVNSLLQDVVATSRPRFEQADVSAQWKLDAGLSRCVVDANHLEQALMGLVTNAVEATPKGGAITIRTYPVGGAGDGKGIGISIEDSGDGIPVENRERVFEPFFTTKPHGTGIGLSLAKKFVERNGGRIAIAGVSTGGTKIEITFPLPPSG
jgi:signal transduction histidine kinase